eukprot:TRINITY_DN3624_c0_g1_i1.p1 TRINITY_DN3624_c0_g1~~TRINITY_DN3624_c0_g1_i1.p1  ORF type:complete len:512 (+),score=235.03 TRINITY_DN3624_c0_g1_i1:57-1592(+)
MARSLLFLALVATAASQKAGSMQAEQHPQLKVQECSLAGGCVDQQRSVVVDANWRWTHQVGNTTNCYSGNAWDPTLCPDVATCTQNCALEGAGAEYESTYGVHASGAELKLDFVTQGAYSKNIGSRLFLMDSDSKYKMFQLKNKEFTFDVDVSQLPCGLNGALYFVQMDADGGMGKYPTNEAGAKYGTGYCDAQCPRDLKFINGEANSEKWAPSPSDPNAGTGKYGSCCTEFDVWEANKMGMAYTAHACNVTEQYRCEGAACGDDASGDRFNGVCDKNGCDFQAFRLGNTSFFGEGAGFVLDTTQPMRVVTQFITDDGTDGGKLVEVRRYYRQGDKVVPTPSMKVGGKGPFDSLTKDFCTAEVDLFQDGTNFLAKGGFEATDLAFEKGMVLTLSLWDDHEANMLWLDGTYPAGSTAPGAARGKCAADSGKPVDVEKNSADASVRYMNIKFGEIGSTDVGLSTPAPSTPAPGAGPSPMDCPGGSLTACMDLCPSDPPVVYTACVTECAKRCA